MQNGSVSTLYEFALMWMREPHCWKIKISTDNGFVPSGNKPIPENVLTQINVAKRRHYATTH